jgi:poly(3-hydroxybutyrate) depolymerase
MAGLVMWAALAVACGDSGTGQGGAPTTHTYYLERDGSLTLTNGQWNRNAGAHQTLTLTTAANGTQTGFLADDDGRAGAVDAVTETAPWLTFRRKIAAASESEPNASEPDSWEWYRVRLAAGTLAGRYARSATQDMPPLSAFERRVTGWDSGAFPLSGNTFAWDVNVDTLGLAKVRVSRSSTSQPWTGTFKIYAGPGMDSADEELESDLAHVSFDGARLDFEWKDSLGQHHTFAGTASGRTLAGYLDVATQTPLAAWGTRAGVLSFGRVPRGDRATWQARTRAGVANLAMNGAPAPSSCSVKLGDALAPRVGTTPPERDDDADHRMAQYTRREITIACWLTNGWDGSKISTPRVIHGYVTTPVGDTPDGGWATVVALNGHGGTAEATLSPDDPAYYYGDAYARRGFKVLALDVKHHADEEIAGELGTHPPILGDGYGSSDFEEDGERTWDVLRGVDWLFTQRDVDAKRVLVTGHSMGAEVATYVAAMEPRLAGAIVSGFSADMDVLAAVHTHGCWRWAGSEIREYIDQSDLHALIAPHLLLVETGKQDPNFSQRTPPWSGDVQTLRRSHVAWAQSEHNMVQHYLHYDGHAYHFGGPRPNETVGLGVQVHVIGKKNHMVSWEIDATTHPLAPDLFDFLTALHLGAIPPDRDPVALETASTGP